MGRIENHSNLYDFLKTTVCQFERSREHFRKAKTSIESRLRSI
jgi:hypothetical protein